MKRQRKPTTMLRVLQKRTGDERGAVLVIAAIILVVILGMAALAIDIGSYYQAQRQAQSAADAGALAAGQDLATNPSAAATDGTNYATTNFPGSTVSVSTNATGNQATVSVTAATPTFFGKFLGHTSQKVSAHAVAYETASACTTDGTNCYAIFAMDTNCASGNYGVTFNGASDVVTGGVHSNGSIDLIGGSQKLGPTTYGNGSGCTVKTGGTGDTYTAGPTAEAPLPWPLDYSKILTACGGSGEVACTGPNGTPAYCTKAQANFDFPTDPIVSGNVYCAYGTGSGVKVSDPSTWTGLIYFHSGSFGAAGSPIYGTWIGGTIEVGRKSYLSTQTTTPTYPVFYAAGSGNCSSASSGGVCMTASGSEVNGGLFSPNGTIEFNGDGSTANFLEAQDVNLVGQGFTGSGPSDGYGGSPSSAESLIQ